MTKLPLAALIANHLIEQFTAMVKSGSQPKEDALEECLSLSGIHRLKARHNCALMAWEALRRAIDNQQENL